MRYRVVLKGFSAFERSALGSYFRLSADRTPAYEQVPTLEMADFVVADADQPAVVDELTARQRLAHAVFVGSHTPPGAAAWTMRPIDPLHVLRELDALVALRVPLPGAAAPVPSPLPLHAPPPRAGDAAERPQRRASDSQPGAFDDTPSPSVATPTAAAPATALLVDDSDIALRFLERHLHALGLATQRAGDSARALELLARERFDFVFVDVELGDHSELDGLALCQHIKHQHRHPGGRKPVVIVLSAHAEAADRVRGALAGCDAYLGKPLDAAELRRALQRHGAPAPAAAPAGR